MRKIQVIFAGIMTLAACGIFAGHCQGAINVAQGKTVTLNGLFFEGGWGGGAVVSEDTLVDGVFLPPPTQWDQGTVWWDAQYGPQEIHIDLGGIFRIDSLVVQADDNDTYAFLYRDLQTDTWITAWDVPAVGGWGMQTRPDVTDNTQRYLLPSPIVTDSLKFIATGGDSYYSVSEIQAYGVAIPEPASFFVWTLFVSAGICGFRRRYRSR